MVWPPQLELPFNEMGKAEEETDSGKAESFQTCFLKASFRYFSGKIKNRQLAKDLNFSGEAQDIDKTLRLKNIYKVYKVAKLTSGMSVDIKQSTVGAFEISLLEG